MESFIGEIKMYGFGFPPRGWAKCDGQLLAISQNEALFSLLGTIYGGDGRTTFGLPDLRGRMPIHQGHGAGLEPIRLGQKGGGANVHYSTEGNGLFRTIPFTAVNFCIALQGIYPSRD